MHFTEITPANLPQLFNLIQQSKACHQQHAQSLKHAFDNQNEAADDLFNKFCSCIKHAFTSDCKHNIYLNRIINFVAVFVCSFKLPKQEDDSVVLHPLLEKIFKFVLALSGCSNDSYRYWSCALFNRMFEELEELSDEMYEDVKNSMFLRLKDTKAAIRCQAIITLHRLQDPYDKEDPIIDHLCNVLDSDFNAKVRQMCIEKLALNHRSLTTVLERIRDVDVNVRLLGFKKLETIPKGLKVSQRRLVLQCGFYDASQKVNEFTSNVLIHKWLEIYDNDYLKLMRSIRFDACEEDIKSTTKLTERMLKDLFKSAPVEKILSCISVTEEKVIPFEDIDWESVLYYRIAIEFLRQSDSFEEHINKILPELVYFCRYIKSYCEFAKNSEDLNVLKHQFALQQLFMISKGYDVGDTAGRQCLNSLVHHVLQNEDLSPDTAEIILQNLEKTITNNNDRSIFVCEIISNIVYGEELVDYAELERKETERRLAISQIQSDISCLEDQEKHFAYKERNFIEAERVKQEIESKKDSLKELRTIKEPEQSEKKTDVATMKKCLTIAEGLLRSPRIEKFNAPIATLNSEVVQPAITHDDVTVQAMALKCYALCCVIDYRTARYGIHIFSGLLFASDLQVVDILVTSIKVIVDVLTIYGLTLVDKPEEGENCDSVTEEETKIFVGGTSLTDLIQALADHLNHEDPQVQEAATKGVCILLLHNRVTSSSLLSRIIIKWANPATDDEKLKQFIGLTLNALTAQKNCRANFPDGIITTIRTLVYAPRNSPLCDVDIDSVIKFMVTLCQMCNEGDEIHFDLARKLCTQMCEKPRNKVNFYFSKVLCLLASPKEGDTLDEFLTYCEDLRDAIRDSPTIRNINKFYSNLNKHHVLLQPIKEDASE